jgi:hypothetical protein
VGGLVDVDCGSTGFVALEGQVAGFQPLGSTDSFPTEKCPGWTSATPTLRFECSARPSMDDSGLNLAVVEVRELASKDRR